MNKPHIEIILPVYNEEQSIGLLIESLDKIQKQLSHEATLSYLFVNDGSTDKTRKHIEAFQKLNSNIKLVNLIHNFGHGAAITCGINHFNADIAIVMDADLQDNPEAIPSLFKAWKNGAKTAVAERGDRKEKHSFLFHAFYSILHTVSPQLPEVKFGTYCLLDKCVVERIKQLPERNRYFPGLVSISSGNITPILVDRNERAHGSSRVGILGLFQLATTAFISFSHAPLRLASLLGLVSSSIALLFGTSILGIKVFTDLAIPGWASTMTVIAFGSGMQLLCLGIMGEYIARIYEEVKGRPLYFTEENLGNEVSLSIVPTTQKVS